MSLWDYGVAVKTVTKHSSLFSSTCLTSHWPFPDFQVTDVLQVVASAPGSSFWNSSLESCIHHNSADAAWNLLRFLLAQQCTDVWHAFAPGAKRGRVEQDGEQHCRWQETHSLWTSTVLFLHAELQYWMNRVSLSTILEKQKSLFHVFYLLKENSTCNIDSSKLSLIFLSCHGALEYHSFTWWSK